MQQVFLMQMTMITCMVEVHTQYCKLSKPLQYVWVWHGVGGVSVWMNVSGEVQYQIFYTTHFYCSGFNMQHLEYVVAVVCVCVWVFETATPTTEQNQGVEVDV